MKNDSWFGHLALCIVLRHRVAVFRRDEWLWDIRRSSYPYKILRGERAWLPIKGTLTSLFSLSISRSMKPWAGSTDGQIQLHFLWHDSSSITERVRLYYTLWSDVPSTRGYCLWGRLEKKIPTLDLFIPGTMQWSTNGIRMASDASRRQSCSPPDVCWSSAVGFEKYTSGSSHLCLKRQ